MTKFRKLGSIRGKTNKFTFFNYRTKKHTKSGKKTNINKLSDETLEKIDKIVKEIQE